MRHYDRTENKTFVYEYDNAGNILSKKTYPYVESQDALNAIIANPQSTVTYTYDSGAWGDVLKSYDGKSVTSDAIGNITGFDGQTFTWNGRQLASYEKNNITTSYKYNADGIRTEKKSGNTVTEYLLNGSQILAMVTKTGDTVTDTVYFYYDSEGRRIGMYHGNRYMYYVYNGQGDVTALADAETGQIISAYSYDAWGNCTVENAEGCSEGTFNPFRYRGYYWDAESGLYYLNSRYYSPELCRFISADSIIDNRGVITQNLFAYCGNNPVNHYDSNGHFPLAWAGYLLYGFAIICVGTLAAITIDETSSVVKDITESTQINTPARDQSVYVMRNNETGDVQYVGRTNDPDRRQKEHRRDPKKTNLDDLEVKFTNLSITEARIVEQVLISAYTLDNLQNARREIAKGKVNKAKGNMENIICIFGGVVEDELLNLMGV